MIKIKEVQEKIEKSKLPQATKVALTQALPKMGENFLTFVYSEAQKIGFEFFGNTLIELLQLFSSAEEKIERGDSSEAVRIISTAQENPVWGNGEYILPWVLDLDRAYLDKEDLKNKDLLNAIALFKINMFGYLGVLVAGEVLEKYSVSILLQGIDLMLLLKKYVYNKHWEGEPDAVKPLLDALVSNQEILTTDPVEVGGKKVPGTFANIFKNFQESTSSSRAGKTNLDVSRYVISFKNISKENKSALLAMLNIYLWMLNPIVFRADIYSYEDIEQFTSEEEMMSSPASMPEEFYTGDLFYQNFVVPTAPAPKNMPKLKSMEEINNLASKPLVGGYKAVTAKGLSARGLLSQSDDGEKGLKMSWQNPDQDTQSKQQEIDKKLEDLEKRIKK